MLGASQTDQNHTWLKQMILLIVELHIVFLVLDSSQALRNRKDQLTTYCQFSIVFISELFGFLVMGPDSLSICKHPNHRNLEQAWRTLRGYCPYYFLLMLVLLSSKKKKKKWSHPLNYWNLKMLGILWLRMHTNHPWIWPLILDSLSCVITVVNSSDTVLLEMLNKLKCVMAA